ncbi:DUF3237 domain-containing protein [Acetanaerobacterium elongatum]|uniref:Uncharacterized protein n=1 Tax=Acetanaerobacterium elongatum TaxID=258515 RepID=A0A1G9XE45_9FIRM|nr:DUF3237 domain-containing protein [Acetanaerobacterium elongatum]SDM94957.1 Protein of unknown function [Acetanaerobacterium elongatum]
MCKLDAEHVLHILVKCPEALRVGDSKEGFLQVIPIDGGYFEGERLRGSVVPGGADWNTTMQHKLSHVYAKYLLKTEDGEYIEIENEGYIQDYTARIKTQPRFHARNDGPYSWLNSGVYAGELLPAANSEYAVEINIYRLL